jgi:hypothetical protein
MEQSCSYFIPLKEKCSSGDRRYFVEMSSELERKVLKCVRGFGDDESLTLDRSCWGLQAGGL